jgi:hypothetical protein
MNVQYVLEALVGLRTVGGRHTIEIRLLSADGG